MENGYNVNKLHIFAEGNTSNGKGITSFRNGCFTLDLPMKVKSLKFKNKYDSSYALFETLDLIIFFMLNLSIEVEI